ncbi:hypothetical protein [Phormidesmis priestleyi]|nr:hypothetical protein [Phormidesmis priestleyi]
MPSAWIKDQLTSFIALGVKRWLGQGHLEAKPSASVSAGTGSASSYLDEV